jgi:hypothetical protein
MSYKLKEVTKGSVFKSKDMGCPIPPPAPRTATFRSARAEEENARRARVRAAVDRANILIVKEIGGGKKELTRRNDEYAVDARSFPSSIVVR